MGANAISITPFGRVWSLHSTTIALDFEQPYAENRAAVARMIAQAKARGLRVLLIPHLWVETGGWRGEIDPGSEEGWRAYQASYRELRAGLGARRAGVRRRRVLDRRRVQVVVGALRRLLDRR